MRFLRLWQERWELKKLGPHGNSILEAHLTKKYQGLKFYDIDENNKVMMVHKMCFQKQRGNNAYHIFVTMDGFNDKLPANDVGNDEYWVHWEVDKDLFDCLQLYYKDRTEDNVKYYELGGECLSDAEE